MSSAMPATLNSQGAGHGLQEAAAIAGVRGKVCFTRVDDSLLRCRIGHPFLVVKIAYRAPLQSGFRQWGNHIYY